MKAFIGKTALVIAIAVLASRPPRKPLKQCSCSAWNEADNTTCVECLRRF